VELGKIPRLLVNFFKGIQIHPNFALKVEMCLDAPSPLFLLPPLFLTHTSPVLVFIPPPHLTLHFLIGNMVMMVLP
jgi:hypothetical protein